MMLYLLITCFVAVLGDGIYPEVHQPQPYSFGYSIKDMGGVQHRQETGNGAGVVKGNYGYIDSNGIQRQVDYVADHGGFRAQVKTNEPGTSGQSPAAVHMISNEPHAHGIDGFPALYGHRVYNDGHNLPAHDRYKYMTPLHEPEHHMHSPVHTRDHHMPAHFSVNEPFIPVHMPVHGHSAPIHEYERHIPYRMPAHLLKHHVPAPMQLHGQISQHVPVHVPVLGHVKPHHGHISSYGHKLHE